MARLRLSNFIIFILLVSFFLPSCAPYSNETPIPTVVMPAILTPVLRITPIPTTETATEKVDCDDENRTFKISFNYQDDPTNHGWDEPFDGRPLFEHFPDELFSDSVMK